METDTLKRRLFDLANDFHAAAVRQKEEIENWIHHFKNLGDERTRAGDLETAALYHAAAMRKQERLQEILAIIDDLDDCPILGSVVAEAEDPETRWTPTEPKHRGVGEGDEGLPWPPPAPGSQAENLHPCRHCKELDCAVSLDGSCARSRREGWDPIELTRGTPSKLENRDLNPQ